MLIYVFVDLSYRASTVFGGFRVYTSVIRKYEVDMLEHVKNQNTTILVQFSLLKGWEVTSAAEQYDYVQ